MSQYYFYKFLLFKTLPAFQVQLPSFWQQVICILQLLVNGQLWETQFSSVGKWECNTFQVSSGKSVVPHKCNNNSGVQQIILFDVKVFCPSQVSMACQKKCQYSKGAVGRGCREQDCLAHKKLVLFYKLFSWLILRYFINQYDVTMEDSMLITGLIYFASQEKTK